MKTKPKKPTIKTVVRDLRRAGVKVSFSLDPIDMPMRLPGDPDPVRYLIDESERMNEFGNRWVNAKCPNLIAAEMCFKNGWAYALAAAYLRCFLKGELLKKP